MIGILNKQSAVNDAPIIFSDSLAAGASKTYKAQLTGNGHVKKLIINFATGENGTLHIRPYVIWNGNIIKELLHYADGSAHYIAGDGVKFEFDDYTPIEANCFLCVDAANSGVGASAVDVVAIVEYEDRMIENTIIGSQGGNY